MANVKDEIYDICMKKTREWNESMCGNRKKANSNMADCTQWIHLSDAVYVGSITPLEAIDAISIGYVSDNLRIRDSHYTHLL
jgi:hypothetical protein